MFIFAGEILTIMKRIFYVLASILVLAACSQSEKKTPLQRKVNDL